MTQEHEALRLARALRNCDVIDFDYIFVPAAQVIERQHARIAELEAELAAIGAGGIEPLRDRRCLYQIAEPGVAPEHALKAMTLEQAAESIRAMQARPARIIAASGSCAPAAPQDTPEAIDGTIQVLKECGGFTEQAPVIRQLRRYATLLATQGGGVLEICDGSYVEQVHGKTTGQKGGAA